MACALAACQVALAMVNVADRAVFTLVTLLTVALSLNASSVVEASIDARLSLAAFASPALGAVADSLHAHTTLGAVHGAHCIPTVVCCPHVEALNCIVLYETMIFDNKTLTATITLPSPIALACTISLAIAV